MITKKQKETRERNWTILRLRGIWHSFESIELRYLNYSTVKARAEVDKMLVSMGAEAEAVRKERLRKEFLTSSGIANANT